MKRSALRDRAQRSLFAGVLLTLLSACEASEDPSSTTAGTSGGPAVPAAGMNVLAGGAPGAAGQSGAMSASGSGGASTAGAAGIMNVSGPAAGAAAAGTMGSAGSTGDSGGTDAAGSTGTAGSAGAAGTSAVPVMPCDRACLTEFNDAYLEGLIAHDATKLATANGVRFTENGKELQLNQGLWAVAKSLRAFRQDFAEVPAGQTAGFVALDDDRGAVLHAFRLKVVERKVTEIETLVVRTGEATFFAPNSLTMRDPLYDMEVPEASRSPREEMIEIVDSYFMGIESGDGSKIPVDASAARNENGTVTARGTGIQNLAMFAYIEQVKRRYVLVDEERGIVLPLVLFEIPMGLGGSRTLHLAELFKVEGGKIMDILAIMVNQPLGTPSGWE